jgi:hypothetical protein
MVLRANRIAVSAGDHGIRGDLPQRCKDTYRDPNASNRKSPIRSSNRQQFQRILRHCPCGGSLSQLAGNIEAIINVPQNRPGQYPCQQVVATNAMSAGENLHVSIEEGLLPRASTVHNNK